MADQSRSNKQSSALSAAAEDDHCLLVFSSLALSYGLDDFARVRKTVLDTNEISWLQEEVVERLATDCSKARSGLADVLDAATCEVARRDFSELAEAFRTPARPLGVPLPLNNSLLIPLVIIDQLTQYASFIRSSHKQKEDKTQSQQEQETQSPGWLNSGVETIGLCTGLLSAFAAAAAHNHDEFRQYGAAAVRIGMLVGLVIDSQVSTLGLAKRPRSLSVSWAGSTSRDTLTRILNDYPEVRSLSLSIPTQKLPTHFFLWRLMIHERTKPTYPSSTILTAQQSQLRKTQ